MHDTAVNNSRVVCRTAGVYHVAGYAQFAINATGFRQLNLRLNGATNLAAVTLPSAGAAVVTELAVATAYLFAANDYVEATVHQSSGGALDVAAAALTLVKA